MGAQTTRAVIAYKRWRRDSLPLSAGGGFYTIGESVKVYVDVIPTQSQAEAIANKHSGRGSGWEVYDVKWDRV